MLPRENSMGMIDLGRDSEHAHIDKVRSSRIHGTSTCSPESSTDDLGW